VPAHRERTRLPTLPADLRIDPFPLPAIWTGAPVTGGRRLGPVVAVLGRACEKSQSSPLLPPKGMDPRTLRLFTCKPAVFRGPPAGAMIAVVDPQASRRWDGGRRPMSPSWRYFVTSAKNHLHRELLRPASRLLDRACVFRARPYAHARGSPVRGWGAGRRPYHRLAAHRPRPHPPHNVRA
jgi:hypothetical protein